MSTLSLIPEEKKNFLPKSSKSTESLYSSSSSKYSATTLHKRKSSVRTGGFIPASSEVKQRVLSARRLRVKSLQNQLSDAQQHIVELAHENRILRTLHKRQDSALSKYENSNAELPQLLHSHAEEIRMWTTKYRNMQTQNRELAAKLKEKEGAILLLSDQNKHLTQLSRDKNLEERERLSERVRYLENRIVEKDNDMKLLARRMQLEAKNFKTQLHAEHQKYKDTLGRLQKTRTELGQLSQSQYDLVNDRKLQSLAHTRSLKGRKLLKHVSVRKRASDTTMTDSTTTFNDTHINNTELRKFSAGGNSAHLVNNSDEKSDTDSRKSTERENPRESRKSDVKDLASVLKKGMARLLSAERKEEIASDEDVKERPQTGAKRIETVRNESEDEEGDGSYGDDDETDVFTNYGLKHILQNRT